MAKVGDRIPDVEVRVMNAEGAPETVKTGDVLGTRQGRAVRGAGRLHSGLLEDPPARLRRQRRRAQGQGRRHDRLHRGERRLGDGRLAKDQGAEGKVLMLADGSGDFTKAMDLVMDGSRLRARHAVEAVRGDPPGRRDPEPRHRRGWRLRVRLRGDPREGLPRRRSAEVGLAPVRRCRGAGLGDRGVSWTIGAWIRSPSLVPSRHLNSALASARRPCPRPRSLVEARGLTRVWGSGRGASRALDGVDLELARGSSSPSSGRRVGEVDRSARCWPGSTSRPRGRWSSARCASTACARTRSRSGGAGTSGSCCRTSRCCRRSPRRRTSSSA